MSTSLSQPNPAQSWKQEVNRKIAAHRCRQGHPEAPPAAVSATQPSGSRAAEAAARVAARYAKAPTYSEMQAAEALAALRTAQVATQAALEAQVAAKAAMDGLAAASAAAFLWDEETPQAFAAEQGHARLPEVEFQPVEFAPPPTHTDSEPEHYQVRWDAELPARPTLAEAARTHRHVEQAFVEPVQEGWDDLPAQSAVLFQESLEPVEAVQAIHANLIEFPRELVAPRKARPRLVEEPHAAVERERQLSIFEVDPGVLRIEPEMASIAAAPAFPAPQEPVWSAIELDAQPVPDPVVLEAAAVAPELELASFVRRLLANVVDAALVTGCTLAATSAALASMENLPTLKTLEIGAGAAWLLIAGLYAALFSTFAEATPGMGYARLTLSTFKGQAAGRARRWGRLGASLLSILPVGIGLAWSLFDEQHLSWHDRLSKTYLRKR